MPADPEFDSADFARLLHQNKYRLVAKKGEGTFSEVLKAQSLITGEYFAIKCMKSRFKNLDQVNSLREIQALRRLNPYPNIIDLEEVLYDKATGRLALVFELMDQNVYELIRGRKQSVKATTIKLLMYQLLKAVAHMHKHGIFHRDIKPENILILGDNYLKVADFGSCRGIYTQAPYTEYISTRWYRAPECLPEGTAILRADGQPIKVEDVKPGMALLGLDNRPVRVADDGVHAHEEPGVFAIHAADAARDYEATAGHRVTLRWCTPPTLSMHAATGSEIAAPAGAGSFVARLSYFSSERGAGYLRKIVRSWPCVLSDPENACSAATDLELDDDEANLATVAPVAAPAAGSVLHGSVRSITHQLRSLLHLQGDCMRVGALFELSAQELHDRQKEFRVGGRRPRVAGRRVPTPGAIDAALGTIEAPQAALSAEPACWGYTKRIVVSAASSSSPQRQHYSDDLSQAQASPPRVVYHLLNPLAPSCKGDSDSDEHALRCRDISFRQMEDTQRALGLDCSGTVVTELNPQASSAEECQRLDQASYDQLCVESIRSAIALGSFSLVAFGAHTRALWSKALSAPDLAADLAVHSVSTVTSADGVQGITLTRQSDQSLLRVWFAPHPCAWARLRHMARALTLAHGSDQSPSPFTAAKFVDPSIVPLRCISWVARRTRVVNIHIAEARDEHRRYTLANGVCTHNCLLTNGYYDFKMDLWGIGCVMFEIISLFPLFPGSNELDQIEKIHSILGTPTAEVLLEKFKAHSSHIKNFNFPARVGTGIAKLVPQASAEAVDLMERLLAYDPEQRITARQALRHPYFKELREAEKRERIRTASPKLPLSEGGRASRAAASAAAADDDADGKDAAASDKAASSDSTSLPPPVIPNVAHNSNNKKKPGASNRASGVAAAAADTAASSGASGAPHKKFPSIMAHNNTSALPASTRQAPGSHAHSSAAAAAAATTLPPAAGAMPPINNKGASQHVTVQTNLASTIDSIPSTDASPSHANATAAAPTGKRLSKGSKAAKTAALLAQQLIAQQQQADAAAAAAAADALSETGSLKSEYTDGSAAGGGGDGSSPRDGEDASNLRDRLALKQKERAKEREMAALKASSSSHQSSSHKKTNAAASSQGQSLSKTSSQHKLLPPNALANSGGGGGGTGSSYQGYSAQAQHLQSLAAAASGLTNATRGSGSTKPHRPTKNAGVVNNALLPSIGAGPTKGAASYDPVVAAAAAAAAAASARHHQQQAAHHPPTLAQLRSSASLAQLAGGGGGAAASHAAPPPRASGAGSPPSDDYYDEYEDDTTPAAATSPAAAVAASSLDQLQQAAAALAKKKAAAAAAASAASAANPRGSTKARKGPGHSPLVTALQHPSQQPPSSELLSLSGHTAPLSMHSSSSTTQLRGGGGGKAPPPKKQQQKAAAAAQLSLALQSLEVGNAAHSKKSMYA